MEKYKVVSLIPARGHSERIPKKNIKIMAGKPMMVWTIEASLKSKYIDRTFVSTEDKEIKEVALKYGAEVVDRPLKYSSDSGFEFGGVIQHFRETLWTELDYWPEYLVFLHTTSPLRTSEHIDEAFELLICKNEPLIVSYAKMPHDISHYKFIDRNGLSQNIAEYRLYGRREERETNIPKVYFFNGAVYISIFGYFCYEATLAKNVLTYIMRPEDTIDVDTPLDFKVAEMLLEERIKGEGENE
ncbi:N-acylneuraminate cytidylyltransferase [subsurface metagenome]